jgi:cell division protein FtsW
VAGFVAMNLTMRMPLTMLRRLCRPLMITAFGLMLLPFVPGLGVTVGGARAWVSLGALSFQPSEVLKLAVLFALADLLTKRRHQLASFRSATVPCLVTLGFGCAIMIFQSDLGGAIVLGTIGLAVIYLAGAPLLPLSVVSAGFGLGAMTYAVSTPYRRARWTAFLNLARSRQSDGYQTWQSILSIANGGFSGTGVGAGTGKWGYVPLAHSDFIFAVLAEELGFLGAFAVLGAFVALAWAGIHAALRCRDAFGMLLAGGIVTWICVQATINIGGVVGLMPVTGLTLPFISYGGSSLLVLMAAGGLLLNVARNPR